MFNEIIKKPAFSFLIRASFASLIVIQLIAIAYVCLNNWNDKQLFLTDDLAFCLAIGQQFVEGFAALVGLPSHKGERHLGPFYPWLIGIASSIAKGEITSIFLFFSTVKLIGLGLFCYLCAKIIFQQSSRLIHLIILTIFLSSLSSSNYLWLIRFEWVNNLIPTFCIINLIFLLLAIRTPYHYPKFLLSSLILANFHLGSLPMILAQHLCLLIFLWTKRQVNLATLRKLLSISNCISMLAAIILLSASLRYEIFYQTNFLNQLQLQSETPAKIAGLSSSIFSLTKTLGLMTFPGSYRFIDPQLLTLIGLMLSIIVTAVLIIKRKFLEIFVLQISSQAALLLTVLGAAKQMPPLQDFFFYPIVPLFWLILFSSILFLLINLKAKFLIVFPILALGLIFQYKNLNQQAAGFNKTPYWPYLSIFHIQEFTTLVSKELNNHEPVKFITRGNQSLRSDAYRWIYQQKEPSGLHYGDRMLELPMSKTVTKPTQAILMYCPLDNKNIQELLFKSKKITKNWKFERDLDLSACTSCTGCQAAVLERNEL